MVNQFAGTFTATLMTLYQKGVRYSTVFDLGCADGHFFLSHYSMGLFPDAVGVNVDANAIYEDSLRSIQVAVGGHYPDRRDHRQSRRGRDEHFGPSLLGFAAAG